MEQWKEKGQSVNLCEIDEVSIYTLGKMSSNCTWHGAKRAHCGPRNEKMQGLELKQGSVQVFLLMALFCEFHYYFCEIIVIFVNFIVIFVNLLLFL